MATKENSEEKNVAAPENIDDAKKACFGTINIDGEEYETLLTEKYKNREKWEEPNYKKIVSEIPGTVLELFVAEGQKVKAGEVMLILEAMKMKNKIEALSDGVVKKINVEQNQKIPKRYLMIEFE